MTAGQGPRSARHRAVHMAIGGLLGALLGVPILIGLFRLAIFMASGH